jgi:hypothetical protein
MAMATAARTKPKAEAQRSGRLLLRLPPALHDELLQAAARECTSLNAYITQALSESLSNDKPRHAPGGLSRSLRIAVIVDRVMVAVATVAAAALVIVAWP